MHLAFWCRFELYNIYLLAFSKLGSRVCDFSTRFAEIILLFVVCFISLLLNVFRFVSTHVARGVFNFRFPFHCDWPFILSLLVLLGDVFGSYFIICVHFWPSQAIPLGSARIIQTCYFACFAISLFYFSCLKIIELFFMFQDPPPSKCLIFTMWSFAKSKLLYSEISLEQKLSGPTLSSALERCPP